MEFWYCIIRDKFHKIRYKRVDTIACTTQRALLADMQYNPYVGDVIVELDCGNHMTADEFAKYVSIMYKNDKRVTLKSIERLIGS